MCFFRKDLRKKICLKKDPDFFPLNDGSGNIFDRIRITALKG